ncbi:1-aminocyclopropane-1-carboxylate deaminase/D-cysteine desulfhydrase [Echinimonas agarilytica]|uniref:Pyridoxal-phosphate dependent enzyme n=1 Tax=Echinimonas agarilytica TaxID=1215918 RepID=A0AA41W4F8_9GAMM|nr:pyridoxal-phosphate dependent enzyme [Echinimonas agarilytica]MCM2678575.1 pyridoxal-phosphate dependent enzyme [Echinimonas agarilytica]
MNDSLIPNIHSPLIARIKYGFIAQHNARISILRDDLNHPIVSGNKLRKLHYPLRHAQSEGYSGVISLGGAYSNHLHALAYACLEQKLNCITVVRGEQTAELNNTLRDIESWGARIHFVSRSEYKHRHHAEWQDQLLQQLTPDHASWMFLPEGGSHTLSMQGFEDIFSAHTEHFDYIACAVGSGGTTAGLALAMAPHQRLIAVPAVRDSQLPKRVKQLIQDDSVFERIDWLTGYEWGGFAKFPNMLEQFVLEFTQQSGVLTDPVYTSKLVYAINDQLRLGQFDHSDEIMLYHSGGLQGWRGFLPKVSQEMRDCVAKFR